MFNMASTLLLQKVYETLTRYDFSHRFHAFPYQWLVPAKPRIFVRLFVCGLRMSFLHLFCKIYIILVLVSLVFRELWAGNKHKLMPYPQGQECPDHANLSNAGW